MREGREDRRVKYTKMVLRESLLSLMADKPISKISVAEICRAADINRNTFYVHYAGPEALLADVEGELYDEVRETIERSLKFETIPPLIVEICHVIQKHVALCRILFSGQEDSPFLRRIVGLARDRSVAEWKRAAIRMDSAQMEWLYTYFSSGCVAVIQAWVQSGATESPEEIGEFIDKVSNKGLQAFRR